MKKADPEYPGACSSGDLSRRAVFQQTGFTNAVTSTTHFRAASNTKTFTSTAILLLHQEDG
ncbi:MAG: serine hydrolase [Ignavibacteriales bacterium]|nr:serine hydrolase [Ignavibacteriales bacterium]